MKMIQIEGCVKDFSLHEELFSSLLSFFRLDTKFFLVATDMLIRFNELAEYTNELFVKSREEYIKQYPAISKYDTDTFFKLLESIYQMSDAVFRQLRGDLTEYIVTHVGPKEAMISQVSFKHDVVIKQDDKYIGVTDETEPGKNIDVCFYEKEKFVLEEPVSCELYECKIDLKTFIPTRALDSPKNAKKVDKVKFMKAVNDRFSHNTNFKVGFATFSSNIKRESKVLHTLNCADLDIVSRRDICVMLERKLK